MLSAHPSFLPGQEKLVVRTESLDFAPTLCLCGKKSDHEMGLKFSVYHGSRTLNGVQCLLSSNENVCTTEDLP